jgi:hypothetical protein
MAREQKQTDSWTERRRERKRLRLERTGDSPEKKAEPASKTQEPSVDESAQRASGGLVANGGWFQG